MGLAFIVGQLTLGGAEQQLYHLVAGLNGSHFRPIVISLGIRPQEHWEQPIRELGIPLWLVSRSLGRIGRTVQITSLLRSEKIQIVHSWVFHTNPYAAVAGRLAGVPLRLGSMREAYSGIPSDKLVRWLGYRGLDVLITNSTAAGHQVRERRLTRARIRVVPNGVDIPEPINQVDRDRLRTELGFSKTDLLIGSIGRIDNNKNYSMLLRAFALLTKKWASLRLVLIGDGPMKPELTVMAQSLVITSKVSLPGSIPLAARYLPAMDVCCLTSYTEGMPNLVMEAAAAGLPVVSTNCGATVDLIDHGLSGYLVDPDDDLSMSAYLDTLLANPEHRFRMGHAGREKMRHEFSIKSMVGRMTQVYNEVLADKRAAYLRPRAEGRPS